MTALALGLVAGAAAASVLWLAGRGVFAHPGLVRTNYRGRPVPTGAGIVMPIAALAVEAARLLSGHRLSPARGAVLLVAVGFGALGFLDDVAGTAADRGFRGHLRAAARGRVTTGMVKLLGGAVVALVAVGPVAGHAGARLLADAALVALSANAGNLLDRAPGRTIKAAAVAFLVLAVSVGSTAALAAVATVVGAGLALAGGDLRERLMLGDAGSNVLGAVLGLGVALACGPTARTAALVGVAGLNLAGELVSLSRVIDAVAPLRVLDRAGQRRDGSGEGR